MHKSRPKANCIRMMVWISIDMVNYWHSNSKPGFEPLMGEPLCFFLLLIRRILLWQIFLSDCFYRSDIVRENLKICWVQKIGMSNYLKIISLLSLNLFMSFRDRIPFWGTYSTNCLFMECRVSPTAITVSKRSFSDVRQAVF